MRAVRRLASVADALARSHAAPALDRCAFVVAPHSGPKRLALRAGSAAACGSEASAGGLRRRSTHLADK